MLFPVILAAAFGQDSANLSITVSDPSGATVPAARAVLSDLARGTVRTADTNPAGAVTFDSLPPSDYSLEVNKAGFEKMRFDRIVLGVRDRHALRVQLKLSGAETAITVQDTSLAVTTDSSHGISMDQNYIQNLPVNGRTADSLVLMTPGITSAAGGVGGIGGGFNANGLRSNTNYYTLDGLSLNTPTGGGPGGGGFGGGPPGIGAGGPPGGAGFSTGSISIDALQELRVQTSSFAPEFGRSPGAQVSMTSRGGTNTMHGSLFYYLRNERLNANDWFANSAGYPRGKLRQNRPGGTFGGPLVKDRTFFFLSYEGNRLYTPSTVIAAVPDRTSRRSAPAAMRPYLNAYPLPNGPALTDDAAEFHAVITNPSSSDSGSLRIDHSLNEKMTVFARYNWSQSDSESRGFLSPNLLSQRYSRSNIISGGWTRASSPSLLHDLRINYSASGSNGSSWMDNFGGAVPLTESQVFPRGVTSAEGNFSLSVLGSGGYSIGSRSRSEQSQINMVYSLTKTSAAHTVKLGSDFRRTMPTTYRTPYNLSVTFNGISGDSGSLVSGIATNAQVSSSLEAVYPVYSNFSAYAQDTHRATERTTLTYGVRWDVNPAPGARQGPRPLAVSDSSVAGVTQNEPLYQTRWLDLAPRFGLAYQMDTKPGREMMFRMGVGLFYDTGYGASMGAFNGAPYSSVRTISLATFPLAAADVAPPALPPTRPYGQVTSAESTLKSPIVPQWNMTIERYFRGGQLLSVGYVGNKGRRLLRTESRPSFGDAYDILRVATNGATSDYHGLQVQLRKRMSARLQTQLSYTYAHSIDSSSNDVGFGFASILGGERGSSDYDIRHNINFSGSYRLLAPSSRAAHLLLGGWYLDFVVTGRTGLPFEVQGVTSSTSNTATTSRTNLRNGLFAQVRASYNGKPVWVSDPNAPGGRRLNAAAFESPDGFSQGNLGRNALRGFGAFQADLSLRRQIAVTERVRLNISLQAFNALNQPNFANPSPNEGANLSSPNFGVMTRMLGSSFGGGGGNSSYQSGGPRSAELALRLQF